LKHEIKNKKNASIQQVRGMMPINAKEWVDSQVDKLKNLA